MKERVREMLKVINRDELNRWIDSGRDFKLMDVLDREHFAKEHIRGALNLPVGDIENKAGEILKDKSGAIVVYCASFECQASTMAAKKLMAMGYKNVYDYKGGIKDYKEANLPLEGSLHKAPFKGASMCHSC